MTDVGKKFGLEIAANERPIPTKMIFNFSLLFSLLFLLKSRTNIKENIIRVIDNVSA